jgi:hypothetical protein
MALPEVRRHKSFHVREGEGLVRMDQITEQEPRPCAARAEVADQEDVAGQYGQASPDGSPAQVGRRDCLQVHPNSSCRVHLALSPLPRKAASCFLLVRFDQGECHFIFLISAQLSNIPGAMGPERPSQARAVYRARYHQLYQKLAQSMRGEPVLH